MPTPSLDLGSMRNCSLRPCTKERYCCLEKLCVCSQPYRTSPGSITWRYHLGYHKLAMVLVLNWCNLSCLTTCRALLYSAPLNFVSFIYIWRKMTFPVPDQRNDDTQDTSEVTSHSKLGRIDFFGAISLGLANCSLLLFLDQAQKGLSIHNWRALVLAGIWMVLMISFIVIEAAWAREPILPLQLLRRRDVFSSYAIQFLQTSAQMAVFSSLILLTS